MEKQIFIINGSGGVGKDTFVELVDKCIQETYHSKDVVNFSSVTDIKRIAKELGWNGGKTEKDRKFLSDLKYLTSEYNDYSFNSMKNMVKQFDNDESALFLFLHIREPGEIKRAVTEFGAKSILVKRDSIKHITSNMADANVYNYNYDYIIENNGTINDLKNKAREFIDMEK